MRGNNGTIFCAVRGPLTLITVGVLFAFNNFTPYGFDKTWPVILIVFGLLTLLNRGFRPAQPEPPQYANPANPYQWAPPQPPPYAPPPADPGGYRRSTYNQPPASPSGPAKGGFGTSAPKPADSGQAPEQPGGPQ
jgi:hypothetical protein